MPSTLPTSSTSTAVPPERTRLARATKIAAARQDTITVATTTPGTLVGRPSTFETLEGEPISGGGTFPSLLRPLEPPCKPSLLAFSIIVEGLLGLGFAVAVAAAVAVAVAFAVMVVVARTTFSGAETHCSRPRTTCPSFSCSQSSEVRALTKWLCLVFVWFG